MSRTKSDATLLKQVCRRPGCQATQLCDAHIIPAGFARTLSAPNGCNIALKAKGSRRAKNQHGYFDPAILCVDCDGALGKFDEYAINFCKRLVTMPLDVTGKVLSYPDFDGETFVKFALAVVWRASISERPEWTEVSLGRYEPLAANILFGDAELGDSGEFEVSMFRYASPDHDARRFIFNPLQIRSGRLNMFVFGAGGFQILVKADRRPGHPFMRPFVINRANVLRCMTVRLEETAEYQYMMDVGKIDRSRIRHPARNG